MRPTRWIPVLSTLFFLTAACDSGPHVVAQTGSAPVSVGANLVSGAAGTVLRIPNPAELPETIRSSNDLLLTLDTNKSTLPVLKDSDGSLYINLGTSSVRLDTAGNATVLFIVDRNKSQMVTLRTGPAITLGSPAIQTTPSPASVLKGFSVGLKANVAADKVDQYTYSWYYSTLPASGQWLPISGNTAEVSWTPAQQGNYYVRLDVTEKASQRNSSFTTSSPIVNVSEGQDIIRTNPYPANLDRAEVVTLSIPPVKEGMIYTWSYAATAQGPWLPVITDQGSSAKSASVAWLPPQEGNYYIKVDTTDPVSATTSTFTSSQPIVFVVERSPLITTEPSPARVLTNTGINLKIRIKSRVGDTFGWSYGPSQNGPWTMIGGSTIPEISWTATRPVGSYFIKVDVNNANTNTTNSYVSKTALVYVDASSNSNPTFGR
jgi:hypothetical protein